ncbi:hypothetical protein D5F20_20365 [Shigella dysenteriae]|nr:hypothetical protein [Shigella dysenteriae]EFX6401250.1 hypothetical protein [Shigella boydii]EFX6529236.1 hypothetical protein [Shigella dysenteriae]EFX9651153.1 hypothetical protein [Shigella dysenteriae]RIF52447.1 hypothetical protein CUA47_24400 [Shigella dysenteriae]
MLFDSNGEITPPCGILSLTARKRPTSTRRFPQQSHKTCITDPAADGFHQQPVMYCVEVAGQVTFNNPAPRVSPQSVSCNST